MYSFRRHQIFPLFIKQILVCAFLLVGGLTFSQNFTLGVDIKNGVNIQASYYNGGHVNIGWDLMKEYPQIEAVRIEIEPDRTFQAKEWIRQAHANGYQVIATYHSARHLGTDSTEELMNAANWWEENYAFLSSTGPVIINLMNEWGSHDISPKNYAEAYNDAISVVRTVYNGQLIIDVPGFGQATKIAADAYPYFEDSYITYSVHIYTSAFNIEKKRWLAHEDLEYLNDTGADCMVGEFCDTATGGADWCSIIDHCYANGWPLFGWAWNGDGRNMNMIEPHWRDDPLAFEFRPTEFMQKVVDKLSGIACYTQPDEDCTSPEIGETCDDGNEYTVDDRYNEYCHCIGNFTSQLQANDSEPDLIIYPNPVENNQFLSIELFKINLNGEIKIINSLGVPVITETAGRSLDRISIDPSQLPSGVYWATFQTDHRTIITKSFVII